MNLIILNKEDINNGKAEIAGKKLEHIITYIKPAVGDTLKTGLLNGLMGEGVVTNINDRKIILDLKEDLFHMKLMLLKKLGLKQSVLVIEFLEWKQPFHLLWDDCFE